MKMVVAYIRHEAFEPIRTELLELGFPSLSITEVKGSGRQKGITERYRGAELTNYLRPKVKVECVVADGDVQTIVDTILKHAPHRRGGRRQGLRPAGRGRPTASAPASPARRPSRPTRTPPRRCSSRLCRERDEPATADASPPPAPDVGRTPARQRAPARWSKPSWAATACAQVARLASQAAGAPVAIVVPRLDAAAAWPDSTET